MEYKEATEWYVSGCLLTTKRLSEMEANQKKPDEPYDIVLLYVKQTIDTDGSINAKENFYQGWLSMEQPTDHDGCLPKEVQWMVGPWLISHARNDQ